MTVTASPATHAALLYDGDRQYAAETGGFLREGLERGHRGLVMAPARRVDALRTALGRDADEVTFVDDSVAYTPQWNAYRVLLDFAAARPEVRSCVVAEQSLASRSPAEVLDYRRLEAAVNLVFAEHDVDLLCPYDAGSLPPHLLEIAMHTHAGLRADGDVGPNADCGDPHSLLVDLATVVPPPGGAVSLEVTSTISVARARQLVRSQGSAAGLDPDAIDDVALAVTEVLTNALVHGRAPAYVHVYTEGDSWVCHVHDAGRTAMDPLVGLLPPAQASDHGYGLWLARQLCTAVDVGQDTSGTHVRLHTRTRPYSA